MQLGLIGLGKMGGNMRERVRRAGHEVVGYDTNPEVSDVESVQAMVDALQTPRVVWVMVPAGEVTRSRNRLGCSPVSTSSFAEPNTVWVTNADAVSRGNPSWTPASIIASTTKNRYAGPEPEIAVTASW